MTELNLTQAEADALIAIAKRRVNEEHHHFPLGSKLSIPLESTTGREQFMLDVSRGRIDLHKVTYQNRARQVVILVRLDIEGTPHHNPDHQEVPCPHLHVYREGYGDKWAMPVPLSAFHNLSDLWHALQDFMRYCNIVEPPYINREMFT